MIKKGKGQIILSQNALFSVKFWKRGSSPGGSPFSLNFLPRFCFATLALVQNLLQRDAERLKIQIFHKIDKNFSSKQSVSSDEVVVTGEKHPEIDLTVSKSKKRKMDESVICLGSFDNEPQRKLNRQDTVLTSKLSFKNLLDIISKNSDRFSANQEMTVFEPSF